MKEIKLPEHFNYVGIFLTFACNLQCSFCLNRQRETRPKYKHLSAKQWGMAVNRLQLRPDLPVTLQGGEPTLHKEFFKIIKNIRKDINIDLLTNSMFNIDEFIKNIPPERMRRDSPYASIRISYHPEQMELDELIPKVKKLLSYGYSVGVWIVDHPRDTQWIHLAQAVMQREGIDCRLKEFLGFHGNKFYGTYKYPKAVSGKKKRCLCKPSELIIAPDGSMHRCHYDLYSNKEAYAHILDNNIKVLDTYTKCDYMGMCNSCDIKLKTNRFQQFGHCSVEIKDYKETTNA